MVEVRALVASDWPAVAAIFAEGLATGDATFETSVPTWEDWDARHLPEHRLVAELDGEVAGWIAVVPYSSRAAYRGVGEESVYVAEHARGRGVGRALLSAADRERPRRRSLDPAGGDLPRERSEPRAAPLARLPRGGRPRADRTAERRLARRRPARAAPLA